MARRPLLCLSCLLLLAAPASGGSIYHRKRAIDEHISSLHSKITNARAREGALTGEILVTNAKIAAFAGQVARAQMQLATLEGRLVASQQRLERANALFAEQTRRLKVVKHQYAVALARLDQRLIDAYETPGVDALDVILSSTSMNDLLRDAEYLQQIGAQDRRISNQLHAARDEMHAVRERTRQTRKRIAIETTRVRARTEQQHSVTARLLSAQQQLTAARASQRTTLSSIKVAEQQFVRESQLLEAQRASLGERIRAAEAAQASTSATTRSPTTTTALSRTSAPSSSGLIWPIQGPITSPFGPRCLPNGDCSFHPGIDIAAATGTPIHSAAAGTVLYAGWMSGYGNLTVIDHGNGMATAYGHQSSIAVALDATVSQGQVIGYVGCTGYCFGPHLHFEVRVNGEPVDPLGYL